MKKAFFGFVLLVLAFLAGSHVAKGKPQDPEINAKATCRVPKIYGDFKGMSGSFFIFENQETGTIKTMTCEINNKWTPQIQITRY